MALRRMLALGLIMALGVGCASSDADDDMTEPPTEDDELAEVPVDGPDETDAPGALAPVGFDHDATDLIDVRGVGDSAFSKTHEKDPMAAGFGAALDRFDASGKLYRGDLSFINWETVVGTRCNQFSKPYVPKQSYAFLSRPENLAQAYERGFNLVGLSNNHTRDCSNGGGEDTSAKMSVAALAPMDDQAWMWAGVAPTQAETRQAKVRTFTIKGKAIRVAFASLYTGRASCPLATCQDDVTATLTSLRDAPADLRILALHSQDSQPALVKAGTDFIKKYNGDVVMGHGPHIWKPVRIVRKENGGKGVFFESLGNFLHPACATQAKNVIGRALFDQNLKLKQVQLVPVQNEGNDVKLSTASARTVGGNIKFTDIGQQRAVYANVKP